MDVKAFLDELRNDPDYADQIVHVHRQEEREGEYWDGIPEGWDFLKELLPAIGADPYGELLRQRGELERYIGQLEVWKQEQGQEP